MKAADRDAGFTEFVEARSTHLRRIAYAICGDGSRADDLLQTALVKLYVAWPRVRREAVDLDAYVRTILVRAQIDETRRPWRRERAVSVPEQASIGEVGERAALFEALQRLPEMQRKVIVLRHWLQLSVAETARELGIGEGTVKSHSSRGLTTLRTALEAADRA